MAGAYSVFANGGYRVSPYLISKVTDADGKVLSEARPDRAGVDANRVIDPRNAWLMDSMLRDVARYGTAAKAQQACSSVRHRRQDRHHQRLDRRLVRRLPAEPGRHRLDRLRPAAQPGQPRNRRRPGAADLDRLHAEGAEGRAGRNGRRRRGWCMYGDEYYYAEMPPGTGVQALDVGVPPPAEQKARDAVRNDLF
jgi:penicillin-binding protein 1A